MNCDNCSKKFEAKRSTARYCSDTCRNLSFRKVSVAKTVKDSVASLSVAIKKDSVATDSVTDKHTLVEIAEERIPIRRNGVITDEFTIVHPDGKHCKEHCIGNPDHCVMCKL